MTASSLAKILKISTFVTIAAISATTILRAQNNDENNDQPRPPQSEAEMLQELQKMHERTQEIGKRLTDLQEKALAEKPELARQRDALENLVEQRIEAHGIDLDESVQELQNMQMQLQQNEMTDDEREAMTTDLQQKAQNLDRIYHEVMESDQVQRAQKSFEDKMIEAMNEFDDQVDNLIKELQEKQKEMQNLIMTIQTQRMQQQMQGQETDLME